MAKALPQGSKTQRRAVPHTGSTIDWHSKVSNHVAFGLLTYTGLHIFVTMLALKGGTGSVMPYFALIVLVAAIVPACRWFEMRWDRLSDAEGGSPDLAPRYRREMALLWVIAIGLPIALTMTFKTVVSIL